MQAETRLLEIEQLLHHQGWLRALALSLVAEPAQADDLVQQTWLAALENPPQRDRPTRPWLRRVLLNSARMDFRGAQRRKRREEAAPATAGPHPSPALLVERAQRQRALVNHVLALPEPFRATVLLRYVEELSAAEIARRHELPPGTVRRRLKEGLDRLRSALADDYGDKRWRAAIAPLAMPATAATTSTKIGVSMIAIAKLAIAAAVLAALGSATIFALDRGDASSSGPTTTARASAAAPASPATTSTPPALAAGTTAAPPRLQRFSAPEQRRRFALELERARAARTETGQANRAIAADGAPDAEAISAALRSIDSLIDECFELHVPGDPSALVWVYTWLSVSSEPEVGGYIDDIELLPDSSELSAELWECLRETALSVHFEAPAMGAITSFETSLAWRFSRTPLPPPEP